MREVDSIARTFVALLLAAWVAAFFAMALDAVIPAPVDPYSSMMRASEASGLQAELDARRTEIQDGLDSGEITEAQYSEQMAAVDKDDPLIDETGSLATASTGYYADLEARSRTLSVATLVFVTALLTAGVVLTRRAKLTGGVLLLAGALLGVFALVTALNTGDDLQWIRIVIAAAVAAGAASAGLAAFGGFGRAQVEG
jgi:hypothetical protein